MSALRALAHSLGLSPTTVSRALDGYGDVAAKTRHRVHAAADAAGYRPNAAARRLRRGTPEMVSLVLPTEPGHFNEPLYIELLAAMGEHLARHGFDLTLVAAPPGPDEIKTYRRLVEGRRADGIVVVRARRQDPRIDYLGRIGFPFVVMGRSETRLPYAFVDGDGEKAFFEATRRLVALGHRRIAHLAAPSAFTFAHLRRRGYERAMREAGFEPAIAEATADEQGGRTGPGGAGGAVDRRPRQHSYLSLFRSAAHHPGAADRSDRANPGEHDPEADRRRQSGRAAGDPRGEADRARLDGSTLDLVATARSWIRSREATAR